MQAKLDFVPISQLSAFVGRKVICRPAAGALMSMNACSETRSSPRGPACVKLSARRD